MKRPDRIIIINPDWMAEEIKSRHKRNLLPVMQTMPIKPSGISKEILNYDNHSFLARTATWCMDRLLEDESASMWITGLSKWSRDLRAEIGGVFVK